jgi:hypothetical protein
MDWYLKTILRTFNNFYFAMGTLLRVMKKHFKFTFFVKKSFVKPVPESAIYQAGNLKIAFFVTFTSIFLAQRCMLGVTRGPAWNQVSML